MMIDSKIKNIVIYDIVESEQQLATEIRLKGFSEDGTWYLVPQFIPGTIIGNFILNIISTSEKKIYVLDSLNQTTPQKTVLYSIYGEYVYEVKEVFKQGELQCGYRTLYNIYKTISTITSTSSYKYSHNEDEFQCFMGYVVLIHNTAINVSKRINELTNPKRRIIDED